MADKTGDSNVFGKHGGFEKLLSYQVAELLEDITKRFVVRYVEPGSRTKDQMVQASRSGASNIAEGSVFSATSKKLELNLTNVARASLVELKKDYAAFLRQNRLAQWPLNDAIRQDLINRRFKEVDAVARWGAGVHKRAPERSHGEIAGNIGFVYCMVAIGLLDRQLVTLARDFEQNGGFSERLYKARKQHRDQPPKPEPPEEHAA
ncbi:MAG: four helix bundle suffix domain-containing protein [Flavobacteriales bacterium]|jgi:four helix bundle suffix protein|nr:four helix bundle suffix domain-containing protein [Flavobacteriales bacterium]